MTVEAIWRVLVSFLTYPLRSDAKILATIAAVEPIRMALVDNLCI